MAGGAGGEVIDIQAVLLLLSPQLDSKQELKEVALEWVEGAVEADRCSSEPGG